MRRFLIKMYDASAGQFTPDTEGEFDVAETTYKRDKYLTYTTFLDALTLNIQEIYATATPFYVHLESSLLIREAAVYDFKITATNAVVDLWIDGTQIASTLTSTTGTILVNVGVPSIKIRMHGTGSYTITWKKTDEVDFYEIAEEHRPILNYQLFPFETFESITDTLKHDYKIIGEPYQLRTRYSNSKPYKTWDVTIKQNSVLDRLLVLGWFKSLRGKFGSFFFSSQITDFALKRTPQVGDTSILISPNFCSVVEEFVDRLIYIPSIGFISPILSAGALSLDGENFEEVVFADQIPDDVSSCEIQLLHYCRLDTDTLTFELYDINYSSVRLSIRELVPEYDNLYVF